MIEFDSTRFRNIELQLYRIAADNDTRTAKETINKRELDWWVSVRAVATGRALHY